MQLNDKNIRETLWFYKLETIIGEIVIIKSEKGLRSIEILEDSFKKLQIKNKLVENKEKCEDALNQIMEYFDGSRKYFDLALDIEGTDFRKKVWNELIKIPYGELRSYKDIAVAIGNEKAVRAIGQANKANPIPIVVPCHRVISSKNKLIGYAGNHIDIQEKLINIEKSYK